MLKLLKIIPIPICGLILAIVSLGNLFKSIGLTQIGLMIGIIGMVMMGLVLLKILFSFGDIKLGLKNPIVCSVAPTFTMALMIICTYFVNIEQMASWLKYLWLIAVLMHLGLMTFFSYDHLYQKNITLTDVYPSWFVTYVGIGVIPITANAFYPVVGTVFLWLAVVLYLALLPVILYRVYGLKNMPEATIPLITIICAPGSLCLTGYLSNVATPSDTLVICLLALSQGLYLFILSQVPQLLKLKFYPSYAAMTFPLVISATALTKAVNHLGEVAPLIKGLQYLEITLATMMVMYVLVRYVIFLTETYLSKER